ncbi:MAG: polysaccharide biosynthesis/export family protein [Deltaproteobacteria bacterium]|nr:polysaccharide biosynthesis/export family protein [Deltaproteobacteria bacterium]
MTRAIHGWCGALVLLACACAHGGSFVWADRVPDRRVDEMVIRHGDLVRVTVAQQDQLGVTARVRPDGRITMPLLTDVEVAGLTPPAAAARIQAALEGFVVSPRVTVGVEERAPVRVAVLGAVTRPGMYDLDGSQGVLHALASAGGLTELADDGGIFVLRPNGSQMQRVRFSLALLTRGEGVGHRFAFQPGDVVLVEEE